jgi:hypothetical protein
MATLITACRIIDNIINKYPDHFLVAHEDKNKCVKDIIILDLVKFFEFNKSSNEEDEDFERMFHTVMSLAPAGMNELNILSVSLEFQIIGTLESFVRLLNIMSKTGAREAIDREITIHGIDVEAPDSVWHIHLEVFLEGFPMLMQSLSEYYGGLLTSNTKNY